MKTILILCALACATPVLAYQPPGPRIKTVIIDYAPGYKWPTFYNYPMFIRWLNQWR